MNSNEEGEANASPENSSSQQPETVPSPAPDHVASHGHGKTLWQRTREATGTVYGDIGTSVLYTVMEISREAIRLKHHGLSEAEMKVLLDTGGNLLTPNEILGGLSLVFWALIVLTIKYDMLVMRADDRGEGGTFALWSLLKGHTAKIFGFTFLSYLVVIAASLLAADGIITPPISMLGAFEPLGEMTSLGDKLPIIVTVICLFILFKAQWRGTSKVGGFFGWFMMFIWFPWIAIKGIPWVFSHPEVFQAIDPRMAMDFVWTFPGAGAFAILGVVVLAITGGEAKYADMGHFAASSGHGNETATGSIVPKDSGRVPVTMAWFSLVLPCLLLNYAGQAAYMLEKGVPERANTFYALTPKPSQWTSSLAWADSLLAGGDLLVSAIAAFIASQALITGIFSITKQSIALGFMPRFEVKYTSRETEGQVYLPAINWLMFIGCVAVTLTFRNASNLAAAYGIAVTGTMGITTIIFGYVATYRWKWPLWLAVIVCVPILVVDLVFFASNLSKLASGGYFPVLLAVFLVAIMLTWQWGRTQLSEAFYKFGVREGKKIDWLVALREMLDDMEIALQENLPHARMLVQGRRRLVESDRAAVFLCSRPIRSTEDFVPVVLRVFLKKYGVLPSHIVLLHVHQLSQPYADQKDRYSVTRLGNDIDSITATYGYLEQPDVRRALQELQAAKKIDIAADRWIVEVGEEDVIVDKSVGLLYRLRIYLFRWILRISTPAHKYLGLVYDAALSKEIIPVVFSPEGARVALPELEILSTAPVVQ